MAITVEPAPSPHLVVDNAAAAIDFYVKAFDAQELGRVSRRPDGKLLHAALRINGCDRPAGGLDQVGYLA